MSVLPVAEALQQLENDGLVESRPRIGTRVKVPSPQDIRGHYVLREALESQAARLCAEKASPSERRELVKMALALDEQFSRCSKANPDQDGLAELLFSAHKAHMRFHLRVAECAGCPVLFDMIEKNHVLIFNWLYDEAAHRSRKLPQVWHQQLATALVRNDPEIADAAMRKHVRYGMEEVLGELQGFESGQWAVKRHPR
jgi:DNA-binding GntR family transcriptional regulator